MKRAMRSVTCVASWVCHWKVSGVAAVAMVADASKLVMASFGAALTEICRCRVSGLSSPATVTFTTSVNTQGKLTRCCAVWLPTGGSPSTVLVPSAELYLRV